MSVILLSFSRIPNILRQKSQDVIKNPKSIEMNNTVNTGVRRSLIIIQMSVIKEYK